MPSPIPSTITFVRTHLLRCVLVVVLSTPVLAKTYVIPHILEKSGSIADRAFTVDTTLLCTYNGSLNGKDTGAARVDFYLYDAQTGQLMQGASNAICGPCSVQLDARHRQIALPIEELILSRGGQFETEVKTGFGVVMVSGSHSNAVNLQVVSYNSHSNATDLSVFGFEPQPIAAAARLGTPPVRRTWVIPHILETKGRTAAVANTFDTTLYATYSGGLPGGSTGSGASLDLYLYDQATGEPMLGSAGTAVCNPCTFNLGTGGDGTAPRTRAIVLDDLITAAGGFDGPRTREGFALVFAGGEDPAGVTLQGFVVNAHTSAFDLSVYPFEPQPLTTNSGSTVARTFVLPHVLEKSGTVAADSYTFDTTIFATYTPGLGDIPPGAGATVDFYLYDDSGAPLRGLNTAPVCAPCTFPLGTGAADSPSPRKQTIRLDDLITSRGGGFDSSVKLGFGILVVGGADPDGVNLQGFVVNSHTSAFDTSVFGYSPEEVRAATHTASSTGEPPTKAFVLPHVFETQGSTGKTPFTFDTTLYATYIGGLPGTSSSNGASLKLYLYDSATGLPLTGSSGEVCNPCTFGLSKDAPKLSLTVEDTIHSRGGGFGDLPTRNAFGLVVLDGDFSNVRLQGFVVNAHTSPFDLSVFGFEPQPLAAARLIPMPIQATAGANGLSVSVPTVIGTHYTIEGKGRLGDATWQPLLTFEGDGTLQTRRVGTGEAGQQFIRVRGGG